VPALTGIWLLEGQQGAGEEAHQGLRGAERDGANFCHLGIGTDIMDYGLHQAVCRFPPEGIYLAIYSVCLDQLFIFAASQAFGWRTRLAAARLVGAHCRHATMVGKNQHGG